jgi:uncharacterized membrane protein YfcA
MQLDTNTVLILIAIGLGGGILSGLFGIGGGVVVVPAMVFFLGMSQKTAQGTTLALLMFPVVAAGVLAYHKMGHVEWKTLPLLAVGFVLGALVGGKFATGLPETLTLWGWTITEPIKKLFALVMIYVAIRILIK